MLRFVLLVFLSCSYKAVGSAFFCNATLVYAPMVDQQLKIQFRQACASDLQALVEMLANDELGALREDASAPLNQAYIDAFASIQSDRNNELVVADIDGMPVGMLQLTFLSLIHI